MTLEEISNKILDGSFDSQEEIKMEDGINESPPSEEDSLTHHGILGMKWGIRRTPEQLGHRRKQKEDAYKRRLKQKEKEQKAKEEAKAKERQIKRDAKNDIRQRRLVLKSQLKTYKQDLKYQEKLEEARLRSEDRLRRKQEQIDAQTRKRQQDQEAREKRRQQELNKDTTKTPSNTDKGSKAQSPDKMTDKELNDAITRIRKEREYKDLSNKKVVNVTKDVLFTVGKAVAIKQLTSLANKKLESMGNKGKDKKDDKSDKKKDGSSTKKPGDVTLKEAKQLIDDIMNVTKGKSGSSNQSGREDYDRNS